MPEQAAINSVLDDLKRSGREEAISVGEVLATFEHRSLGVLLTVFSLIAALPIVGAIPGVSILTGALILIAIGQSVLGRGALWLPDFVRRREIGRERLERGIEKARTPVRWIDRLLKPRLTSLAAGRANRWAISITAALLAIAFFPLSFVPYGVTVPALGVLALGVGLVACDGLLVLIGYACSAATVYLLFNIL